MSVAGLRGDEHLEIPSHSLTLPFLRLLAGPADHTFVYEKEHLKAMEKSAVFQIALSFILYNPLVHLFWFCFPSIFLFLLLFLFLTPLSSAHSVSKGLEIFGRPPNYIKASVKKLSISTFGRISRPHGLRAGSLWVR